MHYNLIKATNRRYLEELANKWHEMPNVPKAVNIMQKTEWVINKPIYEILRKCIDEDLPLGKLPINPEAMELPPKPFDIETNIESRREWKRKAQKVYKERAKSKSKYIQIRQIIEEASHFANEEGFFYPYQLDFRGRIYPKPAMLSPQSADYARALLKFKFGKRMDNNEAFTHFAIAGAGLFGEVDKEEITVRTQWAKDNHQKFIDCANKPFEYTWWTEADKPFCFLAWCIEYRDFADTEFDAKFITTLPIQSDCSNSGLQHYSAMMRDETGGKATNLTPQNKPSDVYGLVAQKVVMKLRSNTNPLAKKWLDYGVDRKLCKKPVMCLPYSLTQYSCRQYLEDHVVKEYVERNRQHEFGEDLFKATQWLTPIVWEAINEVIVGAKKIMKFLKDVSKLVANTGTPVVWTSPLGLPIQMLCYKKESKRVKTQMGDSIVKLSLQSDTDIIDKRRTGQAICPNFIHGMDASVLQLAVVKAEEMGIDNFSLIHDSFGVVAPDNEKMGIALREAFCEIYEKDVLANWAMEMKQIVQSSYRGKQLERVMKKFPKIPEKGNLDLNLVKQSIFFCV